MKKKKLLAAAMMAAGLLAGINLDASAERAAGGGVIGTDVQSPIDNKTFENGDFTGDGGALENGTADAVINNSAFTSNTARYGGAIENYGEKS